MTDHDHEDTATGIDHDRTEGIAKQMGGKVKEGAGKLFGDAKLNHEGKADQVEGKIQNAWGSTKDKVREIAGDDDRGDSDA